MKSILLVVGLAFVSIGQIRAQQKNMELGLDTLTIREVPPGQQTVRFTPDSLIIDLYLDNKFVASLPAEMRTFLDESKALRTEQHIEKINDKIITRVRFYFISKAPKK